MITRLRIQFCLSAWSWCVYPLRSVARVCPRQPWFRARESRDTEGLTFTIANSDRYRDRHAATRYSTLWTTTTQPAFYAFVSRPRTKTTARHFHPGRPGAGRRGKEGGTRRGQHFDLLQRSRVDVRLGDFCAGSAESRNLEGTHRDVG